MGISFVIDDQRRVCRDGGMHDDTRDNESPFAKKTLFRTNINGC